MSRLPTPTAAATGSAADFIPLRPTLPQLREAAAHCLPAGKLLDSSLLQAGIDRTRVYVTNAVKHFKFVPIERGRRLHPS